MQMWLHFGLNYSYFVFRYYRLSSPDEEGMGLRKFGKKTFIIYGLLLTTEFLTITSLSGQPLFCIAAGRQSDGQFRLRMRDNIRVRRSFACGHIANCIQNVLYGQLKEPKKEGNNANFCDKIFISLREKNEILKLLSNFAFLRTYVCS